MTQDDCRHEILGVWDRWPHRGRPSDEEQRQQFYRELETNWPELLTFKVREGNDKRQVVAGWLMRWEGR